MSASAVRRLLTMPVDPVALVSGARRPLRRLRGEFVVPALIAIGRLWEHPNLSIATFRDTQGYLAAAHKSLWSGGLWAGAWPPIVPLVLKVLHYSGVGLAVCNVTVAVLCWSALALEVLRCFRSRWIGRIASLGVVAVGLSPLASEWDWSLLSESLATSLMALLLSIAIRVVRSGWTWGRVSVLILAGTAWALTRDSDALALGLVGAGLLVGTGLIRPAGWRRVLVCGGAFVVIAGAVSISADAGARWQMPLDNVIGIRILPSPTATAFFVRHGMPMSPALASRAGHWDADDDFAFLNDPRLATFRQWESGSGQATYIEWLITHPTDALGEAQYPAALGATTLIGQYQPPLSWYASDGYRPLASLVPAPAIFSGRFAVGEASLLAVLAVLIRRRTSWVVWTAVGLLVCSIAGLALAWAGDAMEVARHEVTFGVAFRLSTVLLFGAVAEAIWSYARASRSVPISIYQIGARVRLRWKARRSALS